jgi:hypothetical protein
MIFLMIKDLYIFRGKKKIRKSKINNKDTSLYG